MKEREREKERHNLSDFVVMSTCVFAYACVLMCMLESRGQPPVCVSLCAIPEYQESACPIILPQGWDYKFRSSYPVLPSSLVVCTGNQVHNTRAMEDISHSIHHTWKIQRHPKQTTATAPNCPPLLHDKVLLLERQAHTLTTEKQRNPVLLRGSTLSSGQLSACWKSLPGLPVEKRHQCLHPALDAACYNP